MSRSADPFRPPGRVLAVAVLVAVSAAGPFTASLAAQDEARGESAGAGFVPADRMQPMDRGEDDVVVQVGDMEIRRSDVFRELDLVVPGTSADVIRQMVLSAVAREEALKYGIDVPTDKLEDDVVAAIAEQRARFALETDSETSLEEFMQGRYGFSTERYKQEIQTRVMASLLLERVVRYDQRSLERDELQVIVVEQLDLAQEIAEKLRQGASFTVLARKHSVHPTAAGGGALPVVPTEADIPLLAGRRSMSPGDILGPAPITLETETFYRILRLVDRMPADTRPYREVRDAIEAGLLERALAPDELSLFEARMLDRYRVSRPAAESDAEPTSESP